ncbi:MAG: 4-hydroxybenzoate octaprenyltransferase [Betaproteobacteria bacterium]|nr:4-hydroxybenzoate octaprenyltransferase [Betaproteobacteria bacterium]
MTFTERLDIYEKLMRLDKPIGILLLLWPTLWGLWMSSYGFPNPGVAVIFILGVVLMRSAGCIVNDFADRNFDPRVERTKDRPLAAKLIPPQEALLVAGALIVLAFLLVLQLNTLTIKLAVIACILAVVYPFLKRFFWLPQAWLGIAFGFGIPMAFAAHHNHVVPLAWAMVVANMFWAIAYDTEYAMVDRDDDIRLGLKSSAILFGRFDVIGVMVCHALFVLIMIYIGYWARLGAFYFSGLAIAAGLAGYQCLLIRERQRERCFRAFLNNNLTGAAIYAGIVIDFLLRIPLFPAPDIPIAR